MTIDIFFKNEIYVCMYVCILYKFVSKVDLYKTGGEKEGQMSNSESKFFFYNYRAKLVL